MAPLEVRTHTPHSLRPYAMGKKIHRDQLVPVSSWTQPLAIVPPAACTVPVLREPHRLKVGNRAGLVDKNVAAPDETENPLQRAVLPSKLFSCVRWCNGETSCTKLIGQE